MADRTLRGSRLGSVSYETERNSDLAPRHQAEYRCMRGHVFTVPFSDDADAPRAWDCRLDGTTGKLIGAGEPESKKVKPVRTHWDMLMERRT
ncbi:MAG: RNA polymerase-binding protein RbpA, partial [Mycobacteriales bacterium]